MRHTVRHSHSSINYKWRTTFLSKQFWYNNLRVVSHPTSSAISERVVIIVSAWHGTRDLTFAVRCPRSDWVRVFGPNDICKLTLPVELSSWHSFAIAWAVVRALSGNVPTSISREYRELSRGLYGLSARSTLRIDSQMNGGIRLVSCSTRLIENEKVGLWYVSSTSNMRTCSNWGRES